MISLVIKVIITNKMSIVTIDVNSELFTVPYGNAIKSEYIKELLQDIQDPNTNIVVPEKYYDIAYNYIFFLQGRELKIYDRDVLKTCFDMYTYFFDDDYFNFLVEQLLNNWSYLYTVVFENVGFDLQRQILLCCPYDFLPDSYIKDKIFFNQWMQLNAGKVIIVNNIEEYYFALRDEIESNNTEIYVVYHVVNGSTTGRTKEIHIRNGAIVDEYNNVNDDVIEGIFKEWDDNGNLTQIGERHSGTMNGMYKTWYDITWTEGMHQLESQGLYVNGYRQGLWRHWYTNNQLMYEGEYNEGMRVGSWKEWYGNGQVSGEGKYVNSKRYGFWTLWFKDGHIGEQGDYHNGDKVGVWIEWDEDHGTKETGIYKNNKKQGIWKMYDTNDNYINENHYVDDNK